VSRTISRIFTRAVLTLSLTLIYAQNASAYYLVYEPYVEYGEKEMELYMQYTDDSNDVIDGSQQYVLEFAHGIRPNLFVEAKVIFDKYSDSDLDTKAIGVEAIYQVTEQGQYIVDVGLLAEVVYSIDDSEIEEVEFGPLLSHDFGASTLTANIIAEYEREEKKIEGGLNLQWKWRYSSDMEPAVELYTNEYVTIAGPVLMGEIKTGQTKLGYQVGWLAGIDNASPDNTFKLALEYEF